MSYLYGAAAALILLFIFLILQKKDKSRADYLLIAINLSLGLFLLSDVLVQRELTSFNIILQNALPPFVFSFFVMYVLQFIRAEKGIHPAWCLVFLPGLGLLTYSIIDHAFLSQYDQEGLIEHFNSPHFAYQIFFKGGQLIFIVILFWMLPQLRTFEQRLKEGYSYIENVSLTWLRNFTLIYLANLVITFVMFMAQNLGQIPFEIKEVFAIINGLLVLSIFYLNYEGIRHYTLSQVYEPQANSRETVEEQLTENPPSSSTIAASDLEIHQRMLMLFEKEQVYLKPKYGLRDLADELGESTHTISRVINSVEQKSFYDFVNAYRVSHLKALLDDPQNRSYTILALGLDSGFNSKASINRIFKNSTGLSPREYLTTRTQLIG